MDTFILTVASGVIVALVGVVVGFYLNGLREKERPVREQRLKALDEMRAQTHVTVVAYKHWRGKIVNLKPVTLPSPEPLPELPASLPTAAKILGAFTSHAFTTVGPLIGFPTRETVLRERVRLLRLRVLDKARRIRWKRNEVVALTKEGPDSIQELKVLEGIYGAHKPYLETRTRDIYESFRKEFTNQHALLLSKLENLAVMARVEELDVSGVSIDLRPSDKGVIGEMSLSIIEAVSPIQLPKQTDEEANRTWSRADEEMATLANVVNEEIRETVKLARDWDSGAHLRVFEMEAERVAGTRS